MISSQIVGLMRSIILARLLSPDDYGLFGMALTVLIALGTLTNMGFDTSVLVNDFSDKDDERRYLNTVWTFELGKRLLLVLLLLASVYPTVLFYGDERLYLILPIIAFSPFLEGFRNIGLVLARKQLKFGRLVAFDQTSTLITTTITIGLALWIRNVQALVLSYVVGTMVSVALSYAFHPYRPRFALDLSAIRKAWNFGRYLFVIGVMTYITTTADNIFLGRWAQPDVLGAYVLAYGLANIPVDMIMSIVSRVMLPAYAELRAQPVERLERMLTRVFVISSSALALVYLPMFLFSNELILLVYGEKWSKAAPILPILVFVGLFRAMSHLLSPVAVGMNRIEKEAGAKTFESILFLILLYLLISRFGPSGAAWAGVITYTVAFSIRLWLVGQLAPRAIRQIPVLLLATLLAVTGSGGLTLWILTLVDDSGVRLVLGSAMSVIFAGVGILGMQPIVREEVRALLVPIVGRKVYQAGRR